MSRQLGVNMSRRSRTLNHLSRSENCLIHLIFPEIDLPQSPLHLFSFVVVVDAAAARVAAYDVNAAAHTAAPAAGLVVVVVVVAVVFASAVVVVAEAAAAVGAVAFSFSCFSPKNHGGSSLLVSCFFSE